MPKPKSKNELIEVSQKNYKALMNRSQDLITEIEKELSARD